MPTKNQLKRIARIHAASLILSTESVNTFADSGLSIDDMTYLDKCFDKIAERILGGKDETMSDAGQIVEYILHNGK